MAARRNSALVWAMGGVVALGLVVPLILATTGSFDTDESPNAVEAADVARELDVADESEGPGAVGVAAILGFIGVSFVGSLILGRMLLRRTTRAHVLEGGVPAKATINSMAETGTTVNDSPMVEFGLQVQRDGHAPYDVTVKQMMPRLLIGRVQPGLVVPVRVLDGQPNEVAVDFSAVAEHGVGAPTLSASAVVAAPSTESIDTDEFLVRAIPANAEIDEMAQADRTVTNPRTGVEVEVYGFVLTVRRDGQEHYTANLLQGVPAEYVGTIGPGGVVPIGIDPDNPAEVAINWRELERQRRTGRS